MSYTTRLMPRTSLMMRLDTLDSSAWGQLGPVLGHEILGSGPPERHHVLVGAAVANDADDFTGRQHAKAWAVLSYQSAARQLLDEDVVGAAQLVNPLVPRSAFKRSTVGSELRPGLRKTSGRRSAVLAGAVDVQAFGDQLGLVLQNRLDQPRIEPRLFASLSCHPVDWHQSSES